MEILSVNCHAQTIYIIQTLAGHEAKKIRFHNVIQAF